ncbi:MAG: serine hydrolase domain-containing protein [Pseudomonadota bacterium]
MSPSSLAGFDPARLSRIDDWMQSYVSNGSYPGASVLLARDGEIAHVGCVGQRSIERNEPYERDTIVRIYSMTKMITTVGLMMLIERGISHLDAPVSSILPEFSDMQALVAGATRIDQVEPAPSPTLQQLLTHTSGMTYGFNPGLLSQHYAEQGVDFGPGRGPLDAATKRAAAMPLAFQPGSRWEYSVAIDVIGRVIEVLSGQTLEAYLKAHILDPLGMADTAFSVPADKLQRFADCYTKTPTENLLCTDRAFESTYDANHPQTMSGGGGLVSTLDDYFQFGEMIRRGGELHGTRFLSSRTLAFMRRNHLPGDIASMGPRSFAEMPMEGMGFGLGGATVLDPARTRSPGSVGDFGWGGMASTYFWTDPTERLSCIFFTQLIPSSSYPNRPQLKALVHAALAD